MTKNWSNILFIIGVSLMMVISFIIIIKTFEKKTITEKGMEVEAEIVEAPNSCEDLGRRPPYSKLKYNNQIFVKKTGNEFCNLVSQKDSVTMLTNEKGNELIFPNEYDPIQFLYGSILILIAGLITVKKFCFNGKTN